jgi:hypothetical protein
VTFTPTAASDRTGTLSVADTAAGSPQTVQLSGNVVKFTIGPAPGSSTSSTVTAGKSASYELALTGPPGLNGTVALGCSGAPPQGTCSAVPNLVTLNGTTAANVTVTVTTTASSIATRQSPSGPSTSVRPGILAPRLGWLVVAMLMGFAWAGWRRRSYATTRLGLGLALFGLLMALSCGGGNSSGGGGGGTPPGTYNLTVTATLTSGSMTGTETINLTLKVQ